MIKLGDWIGLAIVTVAAVSLLLVFWLLKYRPDLPGLPWVLCAVSIMLSAYYLLRSKKS